MAFFYSRRKLKVREDHDLGELNIVPYLDILMNLIMFMLLSITGLAAFGILNVSAPSYGGPSASAQDENEKPKLLLSVLVSKKGFYVAGAGGILGPQSGSVNPAEVPPTLPRKADGSYDYASLTAQLVGVKKEFPTETKVIIGAEADIPYEVVVGTMDAVRESPAPERKILFPDVTLGAL
jgi:biopolymer transport protein TolR